MHHVTVAICTWNRAGLLLQTLEQLTRLVLPAGLLWELIVVNNNSTDDTAEVIRSFGNRLPLRPIFEAETGLSHARNAAVRAARGEYIVWTDDDVLVDPGWLAAYCAAFRRWPEAAFFGGPIEPWFEGTPPEWLAPALHHVRGAYALLDLGPAPIVLDGEDVPFGANYAVRLDEQRTELYDANLGRRGTALTSGEETAVFVSLIARGLHGRWVPGAVVQHYIPQSRQTIAYLRERFAGNGRAMAYEFDGRRSFLGCPYWVWRQAVECEVKYRYRRLVASPAEWMHDLISASRAWGALLGDRSVRRLKQPQASRRPLEPAPTGARLSRTANPLS